MSAPYRKPDNQAPHSADQERTIMAPSYSNPPEFADRGIKPMPNGVPELPKLSQTRALARQIVRKGILDPAGQQVYQPDESAAEALARPWLYPEQVSGQFERPQVKHVDAGELFLVRGSVLITRIVPSPINGRAGARREIPPAASDGRVAVAWGPTDLSADAQCPHRLALHSRDPHELARNARSTTTVVEGLQPQLADMIGREGIEEDLLLIPGRFSLEHGTTSYEVAAIAIDGGSRATLAQGELAAAVTWRLDNDGALAPRRRKGLEALRDTLDGRLPGLLNNDANAERDLRDELDRLLSEPADKLLMNNAFRAPRLLTAPAAMVIGFRPYGSATILDAVQQQIGNLHKRGPKQWEPAAQSSDTRNEVIRALHRDGILSEAELYLLGPRFQEATERFGKPSEPDYRIGEIIRLWYGTDGRTGEARRATRAAMRKGRLARTSLAPVLSAAILEQHSDLSARDSVQTALNDLLANAPIASNQGVDFTARVVDPARLADEAGDELDKDAPGAAVDELAAKGGVALTLLGALTRPYGAEKDDRPYEVLQRMLKDGYGRTLLAEAIQALRAGKETLTKRDEQTGESSHLGTGEPVSWTAEDVRQRFPTAQQAVAAAAPNEAELVRQITEHLTDADAGLAVLVDRLESLSTVQRQGLPPALGETAQKNLAQLADRLDYLLRKNKDLYRNVGDAHEPSANVENDDDELSIPPRTLSGVSA
jgi:hypothetical protein